MTLSGFPQSDFRKGYIILNSNDTIFGFLEYRGNKSNARKCVFKTDLQVTTPIKEYIPEDIIAYRFVDSKYYVSRKVAFGNKERLLFLEYLIHGKVDIFYYRDETGEHYLADKGNTRLVPLTNEEKEILDQGVHYKEESKQYIGVLKYLFQESPQVSKATENILLNHESLIKITKDYHNAICKDEACIIYEKKAPKVFVYLGPIAGTTIYFLNTLTKDFFSNYYFANSKWQASVNPTFGLSLSINLPYLNEKMFLQYDFTLNRGHSKTKTNYYDDGAGVNYLNDISFTQYYINNSLLFQFEILPGRFRPVISFGGFLNLIVKSDYTRTLYVGSEQLPAFFSQQYSSNPFNNLIYGLTIGTGTVIIIHNNQKISIDLRYSSGLGLISGLNTNIISLTVGVPFKL